MRFMLFSHYKEGGKPVNREKFTKLVTEAYRKSGQKATGLPQVSCIPLPPNETGRVGL